MSTGWCPNCGSEYREGVSVCADCGAVLVSAPPTSRRERQKLTGPFLPDDDPVELTRVSAVEAEVVAAQLRGAGIRAAVLSVGTAGVLSALQFSVGSRVIVRRADLSAAQAILSELFGADQVGAPIDDDTLGALAEESAGWSDPETGSVV